MGVRGGDKLRGYLQALGVNLRRAPEVRVGFLEGATYPDGTPVPLVAASNEYGDPGNNRPPRPFFRNMIAAKKGGWGVLVQKALVQSNSDSAVALGLVGEVIKGQLQQSIRDFTSPVLKAETIAAKGFAKPLIDTGHMLNSVDYEVIQK